MVVVVVVVVAAVVAFVVVVEVALVVDCYMFDFLILMKQILILKKTNFFHSPCLEPVIYC
jgi:hypothetical protein